MVEEEVESITFSVEYRPRENAVYYVYRWIEGEVDVLTCYGKVGSVVSVENMEYIGHERVTNDLEILSGTITGYLLDDEGNVVKGSILALHVYYKTLSYHLTLPEGVGSEILQNVKYGQSVTLPPALVSEGLEFLGWDVNGELFAPESTFLMPAIDVVIKPIWKEKAMEESVSNDESKGLNPGVIIGIIVGAVAFLVIVGVVSSIVSKHQKSRAQLIEKLKVVNRNMFKK